jgi:hypothetical protein
VLRSTKRRPAKAGRLHFNKVAKKGGLIFCKGEVNRSEGEIENTVGKNTTLSSPFTFAV